jgi:hypothetical protein
MTKSLTRLIRHAGKWIQWIPRRIILFTGIYLALLCLGGCQQKQNGSTGSEPFSSADDLRTEKQPNSEWEGLHERYIQVEDGMGEAEVDAIFQGYRAYPKGTERRWTTTIGGTDFPRESEFSKTYVKTSKEEGECFVRIYLDKSSYVVGKEIGAFCK